MDPYFPIILTQNLLLCLGTLCFIYRNTILTEQEKWGFYSCLTVGMVIAVSEMVSALTVGKPEQIGLQTLACLLNIGLTPLLPAIPVLVIGPSKPAKITAMIPVTINLFLLFGNFLFTIDTQGNYLRGPFFWVFMALYVFNMLLLTYRSLVFSVLHQNQNIASLIFICLFMISSTTIQLRLPQIHLSWFCVTVTSLLYFIYYTDTIQQTDNLTGLLNRNAFQDYSRRYRKKIAGVMMIDLDEFKSINDHYGHLMGDRYLTAFAICLRRTFQRVGYCYRLGGDEFCILLNDNGSDPPLEMLTGNLTKNCEQIQDLPEKLGFSYGYQVLDDDMEISDAVDMADRIMYVAKAKGKREKAEKETEL